MTIREIKNQIKNAEKTLELLTKYEAELVAEKGKRRYDAEIDRALDTLNFFTDFLEKKLKDGDESR